MGIIKRGTRSDPKYYIRYVDHDGTRRMKLARGAANKEEAKDVLRGAELRVSRAWWASRSAPRAPNSAR